MRVLPFLAGCPLWAGGAQSQSEKVPPEKGGDQEEAMADPNTYESKCVWQGEYVSWKEQGAHLSEYKVGMVPPDQIITFLKKARYRTSEANLPEAKFGDINWKALTGFIFERDLADWKVTPLDGRVICDCLTNLGTQLTASAIGPPSALGAWLMDCAWTERCAG